MENSLNFSEIRNSPSCVTHLEDDADGRHSGGGHDLGAVREEVEQHGYGGLGRVVEPAAQQRGQVAADPGNQ